MFVVKEAAENTAPSETIKETICWKESNQIVEASFSIPRVKSYGCEYSVLVCSIALQACEKRNVPNSSLSADEI